jgi:hypothetical protein
MGCARTRTALPFARLPCYGIWNLAGGPSRHAAWKSFSALYGSPTAEKGA